MISLGKLLTVLVIVLAAIAVSLLSYNQFLLSRSSYNSEIAYSFSRFPVAYDFSCGENDYQMHFVITNSGSKSIVNFSASITNPLCVGGNPILPSILNASSELSFYAQTTNANGTLTISGNNTFVQVRF